jgi:hypothetical protein
VVQKQKLKRELIYKMILEGLSKGLQDCDIIEKLQIAHMSYYRYKRALSKQIANFKTNNRTRYCISRRDTL